MNKKIIIISIVSGISLLLIGCLIGITYANKKNERVKIKEEKLILDENITSLSDMVNFQLNI